jgi:hypothetical protein
MPIIVLMAEGLHFQIPTEAENPVKPVQAIRTGHHLVKEQERPGLNRPPAVRIRERIECPTEEIPE